MSKKALLGIIIALIIPLTGYLILKYASNKNIHMPGHYILDSVVTQEVNGKMERDSIWHTVQNIKLVNQLGDTVHLYDLSGKVIVADFFFTSCGSICPTLTKNMVHLQRSFEKGGDKRGDLLGVNNVQFLSFSIDPVRDSVSRLKAYADKYGVNSDNWWFLTGNRDSIYDFIFQQLKVDKYDNETPIDPNFAHTGRFVLLDRDFGIRGYYNGLDTVNDLPKMAEDIGKLMVERDAKHPSKLPFDPVEMVIAFFITIVVVLFIYYGVLRKMKDPKTK
ncbi:protein SCO1/2 [Arachidicoccus rhizosphaerae]|uniref:Protein SCO1/2 n=1 Tax=Arachidicoccus rhizosphaerae TaxID=551991 RepID=A0A1H4AEP3_9BACT|nr:SCO family protein [Arachidicoccus rhizosphaerae]SEA34211.1 protein SCO1/2 [Arachidicoccus rhizosphaerae]